MKGLKKIIALITVVAMLATLGVSVFAADPIYPGTGITISKCEVTDADGFGVFTVTVTYAVDSQVENEIGVTLLSYTGESLPDVTPSGYTPYEATMQIVGIDQVDQKAGTQTFSFNVTENTGAPIYMAGGDTGIVLIGGDAVTPAAVSFKAPLNVPTADSVVLNFDGFNIPVESDEDDYTGAAKEYLLGLDLTVGLYNAEGDMVDTVDIDDSWYGDTINSPGTISGLLYYNYTTTVNVPAGVVGDEGKAKTCAATLTLHSNVYKEATSIEVPDMTFMLDDIDSLETLKSAIETKFGTDGAVKLSFDDENYADAKGGSASEIIGGDSFDPEATEDQTLEFAADLSDYYVNASPVSIRMNEDGFTGELFTVKVLPEAKSVEVDSASLTYVGDTIDVTTDEDASDEVEAWLKDNMADQTVALFDEDGNKVGTTTITKEDLDDLGIEVAKLEENTYKVELSLPNTLTIIPEEGYDPEWPAFMVPVAFNVTTKYAPTRILGDVNDDTFVDNLDWMIIFNHVSYLIEFDGLPTWDNPTIYDKDVFWAADVNGDGFVDNLDWIIIFNHVSYIIEDEHLPAWK